MIGCVKSVTTSMFLVPPPPEQPAIMVMISTAATIARYFLIDPFSPPIGIVKSLSWYQKIPLHSPSVSMDYPGSHCLSIDQGALPGSCGNILDITPTSSQILPTHAELFVMSGSMHTKRSPCRRNLQQGDLGIIHSPGLPGGDRAAAVEEGAEDEGCRTPEGDHADAEPERTR